jgi:hypothetical protein
MKNLISESIYVIFRSDCLAIIIIYFFFKTLKTF